MDFAGGRFGQCIILTVQRIIVCMLKWSFILLIPVFWMADSGPKVNIDDKATDNRACKSYYDNKLKKQVYTQTEVEAQYGGGSASCQRFINKNMRYPQEQIDEDNLQSNVTVKFIVDIDGQILNVIANDKADTTLNTPFEKEMIRIYKLMPNWEPATCQGKKVASVVKRPIVVCFSTE